jgi:hypothetical protein
MLCLGAVRDVIQLDAVLDHHARRHGNLSGHLDVCRALSDHPDELVVPRTELEDRNADPVGVAAASTLRQ